MKYKIAVVGVTGSVGMKTLEMLWKRKFPVNDIILLASSASSGMKATFGGKEFVIQNLDQYDFAGTDIAFFSVNSAISKVYAPIAIAKNCVVIDNSSYFRMSEDVPLIVPEVNLARLKADDMLVANPNCVVTPLMLAINSLDKFAGIKKIVISTYQAVSGAGKKAVSQLRSEMLGSAKDSDTFLPAKIALNLIPQVGNILESFYTEEEEKIELETRKIMDKDIVVEATCVRVPVVNCHSSAVHIEFEKSIQSTQAVKLLENSCGISVNAKYYMTPIMCDGKDDVYVTRLRQKAHNTLSMWVVNDNLLKGAALNAVQIAEYVLKMRK